MASLIGGPLDRGQSGWAAFKKGKENFKLIELIPNGPGCMGKVNYAKNRSAPIRIFYIFCHMITYNNFRSI